MAKKKATGKEFLTAFITPEIRNELNTLQPLDYNPYERFGPMPPNSYNYWNRAGDSSQQIYFDPA